MEPWGTGVLPCSTCLWYGLSMAHGSGVSQVRGIEDAHASAVIVAAALQAYL